MEHLKTYPMKKSSGWTTLKQAENLIKAGLSAKTADMYIPQEDNTPRVLQLSLEEHHAYYPCWSFGALVSLLPCFIKVKDCECGLQMYANADGTASVAYVSSNEDYVPFCYHAESFIEAVYIMICELLTAGYIGKEN